MNVSRVMTKNPVCCRPSDNLETVARFMLDNNCGEIPVCDGKRLVGVITDRDIVTRAVARGLDPSAVAAKEVMTKHVVTIGEDAKLDKALDVMQRELVRRLPVVRDSGEIVGIVSQADLMAKTPMLKVARAMKSVARKTRKGAIVTP